MCRAEHFVEQYYFNSFYNNTTSKFVYNKGIDSAIA